MKIESFAWGREIIKLANNKVVNEKLERNVFPTRFLTTSSVNDRGVRRDGDGDDLVADVSDDDDSNNDAADALAVDIAADDPDTDADLAAGFDDDGDSADEYTDAPAGNTAVDGACDGDDSNGEGKTNDKGDCDIDCNRAEY